MKDVIQALNDLLEAERAGVEALVDLTRMSADRGEREMLQRIGGDEAWACASLRAQIEALGGMSSRSIAPLLAQMRARDYFAARLRLFTQQQQGMLENLKALLESQQLPAEVRELLEEMARVQGPNIAWCEQHAAALGVWEMPKDASTPEHVTRGRISGEGHEGLRRKRLPRQVSQENTRREASRADPAPDQ
jgi:hypothetical protein